MPNKINIKDSKRWTALHFACYRPQLDIAKLLIDNDANINARNNYGETPLDIAIISQKI